MSAKRNTPYDILERQRLLHGDAVIIPTGYFNKLCLEDASEKTDKCILETIKKISTSTSTAKKFSSGIPKLIKNISDEKVLSEAVIITKNCILPRLNRVQIDTIVEQLSDLDESLIVAIKEQNENIRSIDRILSNYESISKRFNFDDTIKKCIACNNNPEYKEILADTVSGLCDLIETYSLPTYAKYNIALEAIQYGFFKNSSNCPADNVETITEKFLRSMPVITDKTRDKFLEIYENNIFIDKAQREKLTSIMEYKASTYTSKVDKLANKAKDPANKKFILQVKKVKTEKQASEYINVALNRINKLDMDGGDRRRILTAVYMIPMIGNVSPTFVKYELNVKNKFKEAKNKIEDKEFVDTINDIFENDDYLEECEYTEEEIDLIKFSNVIFSNIEDENDIFSDLFRELHLNDNPLLEAEDDSSTDSKEIEDLLKRYNADQKKDLGRFKNLLSKIYRKNPKDIIESTPKIFSAIRYLFIVSTAVVPIIGPIIALVLSFVDHMISTHINIKQSERLIRSLESEKEKIDKLKEKKSGKKKEELEKYSKCLQRCIDKVDVYRDSLTDEDMENRKYNKDSSADDDDLDFSFEQCENILSYTTAINDILEAKRSGLGDRIVAEYKDITGPDLTLFLEVAHRCPTLFNFDEIRSGVQENLSIYAYSTFVESAMNTEVYSDEESSYDDLLFEWCAVKEFQCIMNEGVNLSTIKLGLQNIKKKFKDLSTKQKSMSQTIDAHMSGFMKNMEKAMTSDRREAIIKGSIIPSFSKCLKTTLVIGGAALANPILGAITALGIFGASKKLNQRERQLIYDEIDTELKVVDKQIQIAENDGDMKQYRFLLQYQRKLEREKQRIKYGMKVHGRNVPIPGVPSND